MIWDIMKNLNGILETVAKGAVMTGFAEGLVTIMVATLLRDNPEVMAEAGEYLKVAGLSIAGQIGLGSSYLIGTEIVDDVRSYIK